MKPMVDLDHVSAVRGLDGEDMLGASDRYPEQITQALTEGLQFELTPTLTDKVSQVLVIGTGNFTATSARLLRSLLFNEISVPLLIHQGYNVPGYVNNNTLVFVGSYTGNSEEVVHCCRQVLARTRRVVAFTRGGQIGTMVRNAGLPVFSIQHTVQISAPRAVLVHILLPMLVCLGKMGLCKDQSRQARETAEVLEKMRKELRVTTPTSDNPAKTIACSLFGKIPVVYGSLELTEAVAQRWKDELNENSKVMSHSNAFPQLHHDEIVGWDCSPELREHFSIVLIRDREEPERIAKRIEITKRLLRKRNVETIHEVWTRGTSRLARMLSAIYVGDYTSIYLACLYGRDPTEVSLIETLKREMGQLD